MPDPNYEPAGNRPASAGVFESLGRKLDERPEVRAAEEALRRAQEQFERAQAKYHETRSQAVHGLNEARDRSAADVAAAVLEQVRKHPGPGVLIALACGWFVGRLFRR